MKKLLLFLFAFSAIFVVNAQKKYGSDIYIEKTETIDGVTYDWIRPYGGGIKSIGIGIDGRVIIPCKYYKIEFRKGFFYADFDKTNGDNCFYFEIYTTDGKCIIKDYGVSMFECNGEKYFDTQNNYVMVKK